MSAVWLETLTLAHRWVMLTLLVLIVFWFWVVRLMVEQWSGPPVTVPRWLAFVISAILAAAAWVAQRCT
jgi:hypothetical protein